MNKKWLELNCFNVVDLLINEKSRSVSKLLITIWVLVSSILGSNVIWHSPFGLIRKYLTQICRFRIRENMWWACYIMQSCLFIQIQNHPLWPTLIFWCWSRREETVKCKIKQTLVCNYTHDQLLRYLNDTKIQGNFFSLRNNISIVTPS